MELKAYLKLMPDDEAREAFAKRCDTTLGHMRNVSYGTKTCGTDLAVSIWRESGGLVTREEMRPTDYWRHWPDLPIPEQAEAGQVG